MPRARKDEEEHEEHEKKTANQLQALKLHW
jgi:hypothetical protein